MWRCRLRFHVLRMVLVVGVIALSIPSADASDPCERYLFNGDTYLGEANCPNLPSIDETGLVRTELPAGARKARVRSVYDGDTILVSIGHDYFTVRIMGIDTPEEFDPDRPVECFAAEASARTAALIPVGTLIYLDPDVTDFDRFGRTLRSVWYVDASDHYRLLEDTLVREGFAVTEIIKPDIEYAVFLSEAQSRAWEAGRGLWNACGGADTPLGDPAPTPSSVPSSPPTCDAAYPEVCIPPVSQSGDLDCRDIIYRWFVVLPPDPHNFDVDGDGYGCQS